MKIKDTLNLPRTAFAMRARLPEREPEILARWQATRLYDRIQDARRDAPLYVLHDGPPYANGHLHLGHALNKILKDVVVRHRTMAGHRAPFVPGWDCHGMPIEHQVARDMGDQARSADLLETRRRCREYAQKWVGIQRDEFLRLGSIGRYEDPYLTMDPAYEAEVLRSFRDMVDRGYVQRGLRSIHWCLDCRTALAEAELEYAPHRSPSIHVAFRMVDDEKARSVFDGHLPDGSSAGDVRIVIWTTTPWTMPANLAVAVHPEFEYVLLAVERDDGAPDLLLVATELARAMFEEIGVEPPRWRSLARFRGAELEGLRYRLALYDRQSPVILAEHVTLEQGTGCVHTAPGHGHEDFEIGRVYGLDVLCPVDEAGVFDADAGPFEGQQVFEANPRIVEALDAEGALLCSRDVEHSYPHCWRCKNPLIYRATDQWFLMVDVGGLRERLVSATRDDVRWVPGWSGERMAGMIESRPDWCLSRQRAWGVPIPALYCRDCGETHLDVDVIDRVVAVVEEEGSDAWFEHPVDDFLPDGFCCSCGSRDFRRERDIFDVWFESGVSHRAVLATGRWPELRWPSDLYLEAHDQCRGWYQVSMITSVVTRERPPYSTVVTHGHVLDEQGRKMSKSLGNVLGPVEFVDEFGADILRLCLASVDYTHDLPFSRALIDPVVETYRKIRNTLRFLLGNLGDFDPARDAVPADELLPLDRWALDETARCGADVEAAYDDFRFHRVVHRVHQFVGVTLSAVYLDVVKDRLYTSHREAAGRRAAQTVVHALSDALVRWLAPLLPFTADEAWQHLYGEDADSVHLARFAELSSLELPAAQREDLDRLMVLRDSVLGVLERAREAGGIGSGLEARVIVRETEQGSGAAVVPHAQWLPELFIVSQVEWLDESDEMPAELLVPPAAALDGRLEVGVVRARGQKCERCWSWREETSLDEEFDKRLCDRCADAVAAFRATAEA